MADLAAWAIEKAGGGWFFTGTQAPDDWGRRRQKMKDLRRGLTKAGHTWEMAWVTERGRGGMVHVHGMQHGTAAPLRDVSASWGARVDLVPIDNPISVSRYVIKGTQSGAVGLDDHLDLNGGRAMHWTSGFLHGENKRSAVAAMRGRTETLTWHRVLRPPTVSLHRDK